jgi:hypothetical protein
MMFVFLAPLPAITAPSLHLSNSFYSLLTSSRILNRSWSQGIYSKEPIPQGV